MLLELPKTKGLSAPEKNSASAIFNLPECCKP